MSGAFAQLYNNENSLAERVSAANAFQKKYGAILKAGNVNLYENIKTAKNMTLREFIASVQTGGRWDYKSNLGITSGNFSDQFRDHFGNVHFGIVAHAFGFDMETSMLGGGGYQVIFQGNGHAGHLLDGGVFWFISFGGELMPNSFSAHITNNGFTWGDNPKDAQAVLEGWRYGKSISY